MFDNREVTRVITLRLLGGLWKLDIMCSTLLMHVITVITSNYTGAFSLMVEVYDPDFRIYSWG